MIQTKMAMWWMWTRIAVRQTAAAIKARNEGAPAWKFEAAESAALSAEFERSMTAVAACAFAMEALSKELDEGGHSLDKSKARPAGKVTAGFYVGHHIVQAFGLKEPLGSDLPQRLDRIFRLRNDGVHFESKWREGVHPHPSGTHTAYALTVYTAEEALSAVKLVREVLVAIHDATSENAHDPAANHIANEIPGVLEMLAEVSRVEGISQQLEEADG